MTKTKREVASGLDPEAGRSRGAEQRSVTFDISDLSAELDPSVILWDEFESNGAARFTAEGPRLLHSLSKTLKHVN